MGLGPNKVQSISERQKADNALGWASEPDIDRIYSITCLSAPRSSLPDWLCEFEVIDAEVVCTDDDGRADFDRLHSRKRLPAPSTSCGSMATICGGCRAERKTKLRKLLRRSAAGIQYVEHAEGDGDEMYEAARKLGLEGIVSKRLTAPYKSGPWCGIRTRPRTCGSSIARSSRTRVSGIARNRPSRCSIEPPCFSTIYPP